ncbi:MAG: tetratricopeptide repeat protein, partial [Gemmatimonadales bacterium]
MDGAAEWFRRAADLDPESSVALFYYGEALYNRGLNEPALTALTKAVALNPDNADAHYLLAFVHGDMGQHEAARAATKKAIALNPTLGRAQANLSLEERKAQAKRRRNTLEALRPAVTEGGVLAHFNLGLAFRQKGYYVEALREYRLALEHGEDRRLVLQAMAEVHLIRRDLPAALELYDQLVQDFPDSPKLWNERGVCLMQAGRGDDSAACFARATAIDGRYALAWNNLGVLRSQQADVEAAQESFHQALRAMPGLAAARLNLALLLFQLRRFQLALEAYRQVLADHPQNAVAWNGVGLVLVELKRYADGRNAFARAVESDETLAAAHYNLSFTLSHLGDFDGALRETKRALELEPYYVPQKFSLTIDLQYEDPTISIAPEISADVTAEGVGEEFNFDQRLLDQLFTELEPTTPAATAPVVAPPSAPAGDDP